MIEITIQVPDSLGQQLRPYHERLPELLERGLREVMIEDGATFYDENAILELLASRPAPDQILAIRPSPELQSRVSTLLVEGKERVLTEQEEGELDRYLLLEHLVRLAKSHASKQLANGK